MTNEELIKRFFRGQACGDEESYGFSIKPRLMESVATFVLFSKTSQFPMAVKLSEYYFIISVPLMGEDGKHYLSHSRLVITTAEQLKIRFVLSPQADRANFHGYMERKINKILLTLANDLRTGNYIFVPGFTEVAPTESKYALVSKPEPIYSVPINYQKLMESIYKLLEGESILELPKNQIALLDTDEVQSLWRWLIKENPDEKDRMILMRMYTLSRLLAPKSS